MAKSLRSKRKMRLRTLKREIAEPHYEKQELKKLAILEAAAEAPKVVITKKPTSMEVDQVQAPAITESARMDGSGAKRSLKAKKTIKKRGKGKFRMKLRKL